MNDEPDAPSISDEAEATEYVHRNMLCSIPAAENDDETRRIIRLLAEHRFALNGCACGWEIARNAPMLPSYEAHLAEVLAGFRAARQQEEA